MSGHTDTIMDALVPHDVLPPEIAEIQERLTIAAINGYSFETYEYVKALALDGIRDRATLLAVYKSQAEQIRDLKATIAHMEIHLVAASEIDIAVDREREACEKICTEWLPGVAFDKSSRGAKAYLEFGAEMVERIKQM